MKTCRIEGRRNESLAWGRGRMEIASAEAVLLGGRETRGRFSKSTSAGVGEVLCVHGMRRAAGIERATWKKMTATTTEAEVEMEAEAEAVTSGGTRNPRCEEKKTSVCDGVCQEERATRGNGYLAARYILRTWQIRGRTADARGTIHYRYPPTPISANWVTCMTSELLRSAPPVCFKLQAPTRVVRAPGAVRRSTVEGWRTACPSLSRRMAPDTERDNAANAVSNLSATPITRRGARREVKSSRRRVRRWPCPLEPQG